METTAKRVMCCGTFDYLHPGHLSFLEQAARLGTELHVVIARDENVKRIKGVLPDHDEEQRRAMVGDVEVVDRALLGHPGSDFLRIVGEIDPKVIALGYDQRAPEGLAESMPHCRITVLKPHFPEKFKSSLYRRGHAG